MFRSWKFHMLQVSVTPGADARRVAADIGVAIATSVPEAAGYTMRPPDRPGEMWEIGNVRQLPLALGAFLAVLAAAAVGHGLATAARRRGHDVAILRAVGMTRRQSRLVVITQAAVFALVGLVFGIPLGLALGRTVWRAVADSLPIVYDGPVAGTALVLLVPCAFATACVLAAWPARRAATLRVADVLRAE
jgi:predicted lysophospholipase L1 biosynthesis ABC-type transport system permease subunit